MKTVLLVENDLSIRLSLQELLEYEGYQVLCASNGVRALELLKQGPQPFVLLLDMMMPMLTAALPVETPVVILSAIAETLPTHHAFHTVMKKPIDLNVLLGLIENYSKQISK